MVEVPLLSTMEVSDISTVMSVKLPPSLLSCRVKVLAVGVDITAGGDGYMSTGQLEMSNVDLSSEFTEMPPSLLSCRVKVLAVGEPSRPLNLPLLASKETVVPVKKRPEMSKLFTAAPVPAGSVMPAGH